MKECAMYSEGEIAINPIHEGMRIGICLAVVGGFLDAYTYLLCGGVFANAQTGNIVLLGIALLDSNFVHALYYFVPIFSFILGVLVTELLKRRASISGFNNWQLNVVMIEVVMLFTIGFFPANTSHAITNILIAFICSLQVNSFQRVKGSPYSTTMCTGNLRSASEQFYRYMLDRNSRDSRLKSLRYFVVIAAFCCGAALGALSIRLWGNKAIWACCILLAFVLMQMLQWMKFLRSKN